MVPTIWYFTQNHQQDMLSFPWVRGGISPFIAPRYVGSRQGDVLAALATDPSIKGPIAIGNWSNTVEGESCFVGCLQCPLVIQKELILKNGGGVAD